MSEEEFLARWSRRKHEARASATPPESAAPGDAPSTSSSPTAKDGEFEFDLSSLPSLDSITAATDITAFLHKGIPQELTRAALRRAWAADPAIRDFVGLAENAWDFNDPNAMPGFGPLDCSSAELAALVDRIVGGVRKAAESLPDTAVEADNSAENSQELLQAETPTVAEVVDQSAVTSSAVVAAQQVKKTESELDPARRRTHGGALPR